MTEKDNTIRDFEFDEPINENLPRHGHGSIEGQGDGNWGRITVRRDGSILLENVSLSNIKITNCDLVTESGENPIPFADRMNQLCDFAASSAEYPDAVLHAGHTHEHEGDATQVPCRLCGRKLVRR